LKLHSNYLPSAQQRWCTINLKLKPFEQFAGEDAVISYVGIRADEPQREGYISTKPNIKTCFPFKDDGLVKADIMRILDESGLGLPKYYEWRSRSGCYFCFYQRKIEWVGLYENHPERFEMAKQFEKYDEKTGKRYTWSVSV
jgi:3'-phosphoadenosine 5'-phosphosulfate sulfotransferase (PAPS reductase)/FAD synthetase